MSVYKKTGRATYAYDFVLQGRRFSGDTGATSKREAKRIEDERKQQASVELADAQAFFAETMTFEIAVSRWWLEVGKHHQNDTTTIRNIEWLKKFVGTQTDLRDINDNMVASLVARRRGERVKTHLKNGKVREGNLIGPATVNRTCTQPLREIFLRAKNVWKVKCGDVDFGKHILKEPQERVREASAEEENSILDVLGRGYDAAVKFAFLTGCRRMEILALNWTDIDFFTRRFTVLGKGQKSRTLPMSDEIYDLLWDQKNHHVEKVFTYEALKTQKQYKRVRGERYPLTESGLKSAMRRAVPKAGVQNFRFHDTRHTAATRVLRKSNLRVAQRLLGHSDIKTTTKYAHALDEDIRAALEATGTPAKKDKTEDNRREQGENTRWDSGGKPRSS